MSYTDRSAARTPGVDQRHGTFVEMRRERTDRGRLVDHYGRMWSGAEERRPHLAQLQRFFSRDAFDDPHSSRPFAPLRPRRPIVSVRVHHVARTPAARAPRLPQGPESSSPEDRTRRAAVRAVAGSPRTCRDRTERFQHISPYTASDKTERSLFLQDQHLEQVAALCADIEVSPHLIRVRGYRGSSVRLSLGILGPSGYQTARERIKRGCIQRAALLTVSPSSLRTMRSRPSSTSQTRPSRHTG